MGKSECVLRRGVCIRVCVCTCAWCLGALRFLLVGAGPHGFLGRASALFCLGPSPRGSEGAGVQRVGEPDGLALLVCFPEVLQTRWLGPAEAWPESSGTWQGNPCPGIARRWKETDPTFKTGLGSLAGRVPSSSSAK